MDFVHSFLRGFSWSFFAFKIYDVVPKRSDKAQNTIRFMQTIEHYGFKIVVCVFPLGSLPAGSHVLLVFSGKIRFTDIRPFVKYILKMLKIFHFLLQSMKSNTVCYEIYKMVQSEVSFHYSKQI